MFQFQKECVHTPLIECPENLLFFSVTSCLFMLTPDILLKFFQFLLVFLIVFFFLNVKQYLSLAKAFFSGIINFYKELDFNLLKFLFLILQLDPKVIYFLLHLLLHLRDLYLGLVLELLYCFGDLLPSNFLDELLKLSHSDFCQLFFVEIAFQSSPNSHKSFILHKRHCH